MTVKKLFWESPYLTEVVTTVATVDGPSVTLDQTVAYAFSGGQQSDVGTIGGWEIVDAACAGQDIVYTLPADHALRPGDAVTVAIDWDARYRVMRLHFAAELVLELVTQLFGAPEKTGAHIAGDKARLDFAWRGNISEVFPQLEAELARLVDADLAIRSDYSDESIQRRYWEIEGFALVPCGGTHLRRTGEVGRVSLRRSNPGGGRERIEIRLED